MCVGTELPWGIFYEGCTNSFLEDLGNPSLAEHWHMFRSPQDTERHLECNYFSLLTTCYSFTLKTLVTKFTLPSTVLYLHLVLFDGLYILDWHFNTHVSLFLLDEEILSSKFRESYSQNVFLCACVCVCARACVRACVCVCVRSVSRKRLKDSRAFTCRVSKYTYRVNKGITPQQDFQNACKHL